MYQNVLVPLDGSELAECALPEVIKLGRGGNIGEVILLRIIEIEVFTIPQGYTKGIDLVALRNAHQAEAGKYLEDIQSRFRSEGITATTATLEGRPADTIVEFAKNRAVDLIVIGTHGYTGLKRLMFGSVALRVLHDANVPILLIRSVSCQTKA
jgi:nucleotide-binding universal stress UspA family protein